MNGIEEMAEKIEEAKRHKEVVKALDWGSKYITSLLRPYEMEIKRHLDDNPATISIAVFWKKPEELKEKREKMVVDGAELHYSEETGEWSIIEHGEGEGKP